MKSTLAEGQGLCDMISDNLLPDALPPVSHIGLVGIVNSPPSLESVQFLPLSEEGTATMGVLQGVSDHTRIASQQANFTHTFLKSILTSIDSKDPVVANAWLETLLDVIDLLPKEVVKEEILGLAVTKGQSQQVLSRLASCKLIGKISTKFEPYVLKSEVVGVVQSLCQDVSGEVRGSMCTQLASVARGVGLNTTKSLILPELVDLCSDEEVNVRLAGINTVVQMLPLVDQDTRSNTLVPLVRKICERALRVEDASLPVTAHHLGRICHGLHDELMEDQKDWFIKFYCTLAKLGLPDAKKTEMGLPMPDLVVEVRSGEYEAECRQQCAYNLPAMIVFAGGPPGYRKFHLHDALLSFITDPSSPVRNTLALSFHQLCTLIGSEVAILREAFLNLLRSENLEVTAALVPNISHILAAFNHHQVITHSSQQTEVLELVGAIKQGEETVGESSNWRVHSEMLRQIAALALCLPPDLLFSEVVPLMILRMHTVRPIPCRQAAARTLLVFLRHMDSPEQRDHIYNTLVIEFGEGKSCHKRMLFLNVCQMSLDLLPLGLFKIHLFKPLLALHTDPVPNIRLKLVTFLPVLKGILTLPEDRQRLQDLETIVGSLLMSETDKDVSASVSGVITELDKIEVAESKRGSPEGQEVSGAMRDSFSERNGIEGEKTAEALQENESFSSPSMDTKKGSAGGGGGMGGVCARRNNVPGRIPSYVAAERRRSSTFAPELPPDESAVKRGIWTKDRISDADLSILCDEVLLSPEEPTSIDWADIVDSSNEGSDDRDFSLIKKEKKEIDTSFPSIDRLSLDEFADPERKTYRMKRSERALRKFAKERFLDDDDDSFTSSFPKREAQYQNNASSVVKQDAKSKFLSGKYPSSSALSKDEVRENASELTPRQRFWMRTSRTKWRRKVASADTSPEEPRRAKFSRGNSIETGRTCFSDTEDPESHYMFEEQFHQQSLSAAQQQRQKCTSTKVPKLPPVSVVPVSVVDQIYDEPSPPSPHGMYTWPPQHTRHRHHCPVGEEENSAGDMNQHAPKVSEEHYKDDVYEAERLQLSKNYGEELGTYRVSSLARNFTSPHLKLMLGRMGIVGFYGDDKADSSELMGYEGQGSSSSSSSSSSSRSGSSNFLSTQPQAFTSSYKSLDRSSDYYESASEGNSFDKYPWDFRDPRASYQREPPPYPLKPAIPDPFNYHPNSIRSAKNHAKDDGYPSSMFLGSVSKDTLSLLLSATPKSSKVYEGPPHSSGGDYVVSSATKDHMSCGSSPSNTIEEDLYAVHGIPPTVPRRVPPTPLTSSRTSFPHEMLEDDFFPSSFSSTSHHDATCPPSDSTDLSYKEVRYHLAAAAMAAEHEWRDVRGDSDRPQGSPKTFSRRGYGVPPPSYVLLDSAELAPWSPSAAAYPIGPLGASWLQRHGFPSPVRHPAYFFPPPRPSPLSFIAPPLWPTPAHPSSFRSLSAIDPTADEFLVDAGVRFDAAVLRPGRPRHPPPSHAHGHPPSRAQLAAAAAAALERHAAQPSATSTSRASKIPVVGRTSEGCSPLQGVQGAVGAVKTRPRMTPRPSMRPISGVATSATSRGANMGGSRGKSLSHENLRPGDAAAPRLGTASPSAKTSPVSSRPSSPNSLPPRRGPAGSSPRVHGGGGDGERPKTTSTSPSGSRCSSPGGEEGRGRRGGSATSSPSSSRCSSPGGTEDNPRSNLQRRTTVLSRISASPGGGVPCRPRQVPSSIPIIGGTAKGGRGSKLPLPTSKK